jgi:hypothetical protein
MSDKTMLDSDCAPWVYCETAQGVGHVLRMWSA